MYGQEIRPKRSFDEIARDVDAEFSAPIKPQSPSKKPRRSFDEIARDVDAEFSAVENAQSAPTGKRQQVLSRITALQDELTQVTPQPTPNSAPPADTTKPMIWEAPEMNEEGLATGRGVVITKPEGVAPRAPRTANPREREAARLIRDIEGRRNRATELFRLADAAERDLTGIDTGKSKTNAQTLRQQAEAELYKANLFADGASARYGDLIETGFGADADPTSKRKWAYAKARTPELRELIDRGDLETGVIRRRFEAEQRQITPEDRARYEKQRKIETSRAAYEELSPVARMAARAFAKYGNASDADMAEAMPVSTLESIPGQVVQGAITTAARIPEGLQQIDPFGWNAQMREEQRKRGFTPLPGKQITKAGDDLADVVAPIDKTDEGFFTAKLPRGLGSSAPFIVSSALGGGMPAAAILGSAINAQQTAEDLDKKGITDEATRRKATAVAGLIGSLEALGIEGRLNQVFGGRNGLVKRLMSAGGEGVQEWTTEQLNDINAALITAYDPNRNLDPLQQKQLESFALGALTGGLFEAGGKAAEFARGETTPQIRSALDTRAARNFATAVSRTPAPTDIRPTVPVSTQTTITPLDPSVVRGIPRQVQAPPSAAVNPSAPVEEALPASPAAVVSPVTPAPVSSPANSTLAQPIAPLFPQAQTQPAARQNLEHLSPEERKQALIEGLRAAKQGRVTASLEQQLNTEFTEGAGLVNSAAQSWDTDRPTAELLATTGAQRLKTALQNLQKSEAYQMELGAVASGAGQPGPYIAAAQSIQQQLDQADSLFRLDAERERQQAELLREQEKQQKKVEKEAAKQAKFTEREQLKLDRQLQVEQQREQAQAKRDEAAAKRMETARAAQEARRAQLEQQREQSRNEKTRKIADAELQRMQLHDAALEAADTAGQRHQEYLNQGMIAEAINELTVQQKQLQDAVRQLPRTPQAQTIKADLNRYQGQIGNRIGDLRKQMRGQQVPVTQPIPPLFQPSAAQNPAGGVPELPSFYEPGAVFDREVGELGDTEIETTPLLTTIRRLGGIRADGISDGELERLGVRESGTTGLINNRGGLAPDRMREALAEEGLLPQDSTVDDLFQAIEGEMRGGRRGQGKETIADFYDRWEAEQADRETERRGDGETREAAGSAIRNPQSAIEEFADEDAEDMAALQRSIARSQADNPRPYNERTRPGEPGSGGISFSDYAYLESRNVEPERALYENEPTSETFKDAVEWITEDAAKTGIGQRHVDAMIAYALNWHGEKAFWESQGLSMDTVQQSSDSLDVEMDSIRQQVAELPRSNYRTEAEREIAALDTLFDDPDAVNLLERIIRGEDNAADEFKDYAATEHGLSGETISDLIVVRQRARRSVRPQPATQRVESASNARNLEARSIQNLKPLYELLRQNPATIPDVQFDSFLTSLESWRNEGIHGSDFGGVDLPPSLEQDLRRKLAATNEERKNRVKAKRLSPKHTPLPIPTPEQRAERQRLVEATRDLPPEEQQRQMTELRRRQRESGESGRVLGKEELADAMRQQQGESKPAAVKMMLTRDDRQQLADLGYTRAEVDAMSPQEGAEIIASGQTKTRTVTHPDPTIDGKPILAETGDGRVIVPNPENKSGISVVKDRSGEVESPSQPASKRGRLALAVADHLTAGNKFTNIVEARKFIAQQTGEQIKPGSLDAKQVDEAIEAGAVMAARRIVAEGKSPKETFRALLGLQDRLPTLSARTSTSVLQQAYSTPLPLAYVASQLAGIDNQTTVYEPSAGHSALLIAASPKKVVANELNEERAAALRDILPGAEITEHDAADWKPDRSVDRVITNPPFGAVKDDSGKNRRFQIDGKYETSEIDHAIAFEALKAMKDDGKAVLIVAGLRSDVEAARSAAYNTGAKRNFYFTLYNQYNVVDHFTVNGDLYNKQGAGWPVDVIVIDGRGKSQRDLPAVAVPQILNTWEAVGAKLDASTRRTTEESSSAADVRMGERGLPDSQRSSRPDERATDAERVSGVPARSSERDARSGAAADMGAPVADRPTGSRRAAESAPEPAQSGRSSERTDIQQSGTTRTPEQPGGVSGARDRQQGQSAGKATGQGDQPGTVDQRTDRGAGRASDVGNVFDEEFDRLFGEDVTPQDQPQQRTTKEAAKSAAKESKDTLKEIAKGLSGLFGGPKLSSGLTFDEKTYAAAKPHFEAAMQHFQQATRDVREVMASLLKELNQQFGFQPDVLQKMKPYIVRFVEEQTGQLNQLPKSGSAQAETAATKPATTTSQDAEADSDTHRVYKPASGSYSVGTLVPVNMASAVENSLRRLQDEVGDLDTYVADRLGYRPDELSEYFSGEQVDAVALAVRNIENGGAFVVGDATGVGKGRIVAGVIRYAIKQKLTPIFVTEKPTLYGDMIRDLADIGSADVKPLVTNAGESVPLDDDALAWYGEAERAKLEGRPVPAKRGKFLQTKAGNEHNGMLKRFSETGNLGGHHVIFTTYNQMQTVKGKRTDRHDLLERFARGGIVIFDESHNAGGAGKVETDDKGEVKFDRATFARQLARDAKGLLYSSATFAKRPEVMDLYFRTELGKAVGDLAELSEITSKGGVPMQQVIASMLAESGQYIRRERSFSGVEYAPTPTKVDRKTAESVSRAMREVARFDLVKQEAVKTLAERVKKEAKRITGDGTVGQAGVHSTNFTSLMHNLIDQSLLALKVDQAADMAIAALERGEKPVITVANTMGSFIQRFAEENELQPGAPITLSFNDLLDRYLERSREVIVGKPYGEKFRHYLSDEELGDEGVEAYKAAKEVLESLNLDIPISPIDWLHKRLRDAGYRTGEITGRGHIVNYTNDGPVYTTRPMSETSTAAKKRTIAAFNDGTMDVIILNQSGSTGISLHASEKFKDQRRRHMIIAQSEKNIDTHCLDLETEILTPDGFKSYQDEFTQVAAFDLETGSVSWQPVEARVLRPLADDEKMIGIESPGLSLRVTDNHRMVFKRNSRRSWEVATAGSLSERYRAYTIPLAGVQPVEAPLRISKAEIQLIGWFLTDGSLNRASHQLMIWQAEHQPWNAQIRACLEEGGFKYAIKSYTGNTSLNETSPRLCYYLPKGRNGVKGWGCLESYLDKNFSPLLENLSREQLAVLLETLHFGDGSKFTNQEWTQRSYHIATGNRVFAERLQSLCVRRGFKCNLAERGYNQNPLYFLHIKDEAERYVGGRGHKDRPILTEVPRRDNELVWCIENPAGTLIIRRHGKVAIVGNCQMLGRVHRTGQVIPPRYTQMVADIPAELRPAAVLAKKMASLNANTTASRSSAVTAKDVPDFLNKYGDEVAASLMESNPELHEMLGRPLKDSEKKEGYEREDAMRKVTGRIPLLPIKEQEEVYEQLIDEYADTLQQAEASGENALEAKTLDLQAETTKTQLLVPGSGASLFEQAANLERVKSNRQGKPFKSNEVIEKLQAALGSDARNLVALGRAGAQQVRQMRGDLEAEVAAYKNKVEEEHGGTKRAAIDQLAADKWLNRWNQITGTVYPGAAVQIAGGYGVVLNVERKGKRSNPVALSGWRATVMMADGRRQLQVPFSKIDLGEATEGAGRTTIRPGQDAITYDPEKEDFVTIPILDAFDKGLSATKETRYVVTGNLIAGFSAAPNGQIVNFTDDAGRVKQGILMPVRFDPADVAGKQKEKLKTAEAVLNALTDARGEVTDREGNLTIRRAIGGGGYVVSVPSAKGRGGKYYLNRALLAAAGRDFAKRGGLMEVQVGESSLRRMVDVLLKGEGMPTAVGLQAKMPKIAERRSDAPFTERYTVRDLATNATAEYRPATNRPGTVFLNEWGHALLRDTLVTVYGEKVAGIPGDFTLDTASLRRAADAMRDRADGAFIAIADKLETAADDADVNGRDVALVTRRAGQSLADLKATVRHETIHAAQSAVDTELTGAATMEWLNRQPKARQIKAELERRGYKPSTFGFEAVAFVASGDFGVFGMSLDEATRLMDSYYQATVRKYGASALAKFGAIDPKLQPTLERARRETQPGRTNPENTTQDTGRSDRRAESQTGRNRAGDGGSSSAGQRGTEEVPRVAERRERRFSFGELENEPTGTILASGLGAFQSLRGTPKPKTTPLREIIAEHQPLVVNPYKIQDMAMDEILNASERGIAGTLPGARALYWTNKLKLKKLTDKLADRQANFISKTIEQTNDMIAASEAMRAAEPGSEAYQKAKKSFERARLKLADALAKAGEYTTLPGYAAKTYKTSLLSAPHIHLFNMLEQALKLPLHQAQRAVDLIVPASILNKYGIPYEKAVTDFRDLVPAIEAELRGLGAGAKEIPRDVADMFRYGITRQMQQADDAEQGHAGGTDKFELGHRAKLIPGLDQVLNFIGRSHGAADIAFTNLVNATAISAQANAIARKFGKENSLSKKKMDDMARDLAYRPSALMITLANDAALRFKLDYPTLAYDALQKLRDLPSTALGKATEKGVGKAVDSTWKAAMDFIVPFSKIPLAAVDTYLFRYSPVAFGRVAGRMAMAKGGEHTGRFTGEFAKQRFAEDTAELFRQGVVGSLSWALLGALGSFGYLAFTGGGEDDKDRPNVKNLREALRVPYGPEVRVGDIAFNLNRMGPLGQAAGIATRIAEAQKPRTDPKTGEPEEIGKRIARTATAAKDALIFNNPLGSAAKDLAGDDMHSTSAGQYIAGKLRGFVPGLARDIAKIQSPTKRMPETSSTLGRFKGDLQSGMPVDIGFGSREQMTERVDALGRPIEEPNPFKFWREIPRNPQLEEMERLGVGFSKPRKDKEETATEYNRRIAGYIDPKTGERVPGAADQLQKALRRIADDANWARRSDEAKARIYSTELQPKAIERADKLSEESILAEREIEALRADTFEALRALPAYRQARTKERKAIRKEINDALDDFRATAQGTRRSKSGKVSVVREKAARLPDIDPQSLARWALDQAGK